MALVPAENVGEPRTPSPPAQPWGYPPPRQRPSLSPPSSLASAHLSPQPSAPHDINYYLTEGLNNVEHQRFKNNKSFIGDIDKQVTKLRSGNASQYLVFTLVTQDQFVAIERMRQNHHKGIRFHYFNREETLIVKIFAGPVQALVGCGFGTRLDIKIGGMGLVNYIFRTDTATHKGNGSQKQANIAWTPWSPHHGIADWPTVVIECGVSQSRDRLEVDANWWFENSGGKVKIVFLISFSQEKKEIHFQQWELVTVPDSHVFPGQPRATRTVPTIMRKFDLVPGVPNKESLMLNFERIFLRPPALGKGQREGDITFSQEELEEYANHVWAHANDAKIRPKH
ncbi:hypothetical protein B9Z19DRAFT_660284 [Tuber borchii]|uniref:Uncharacterized protein n=1 Tax=Tuber borchii TaxID=42251 RepID=A0A2T6ZAK2_TUBBO|nr:hypothetical protein B9Z19DRAFT_660284 [Tuber borchii]